VGGEDDAREVLLELVGGEIGEQDASHAGAVGREAAADMQVNGHDPGDGGASDVDDLVSVESGDREGLAEGCGQALEDGLGGGGERVRRGVGMGEGEHARAQGVARAVFGPGEAEFGEGVEATANGGARETGLDAELRDGHLGCLLGEGLNDDKTAGERGHEVGIACEGVERGGGRGLGCNGCRGGSSRNDRWGRDGEGTTGA